MVKQEITCFAKSSIYYAYKTILGSSICFLSISINLSLPFY